MNRLFIERNPERGRTNGRAKRLGSTWKIGMHNICPVHVRGKCFLRGDIEGAELARHVRPPREEHVSIRARPNCPLFTLLNDPNYASVLRSI